jgi:hypothetical protein
MPFPSMPCGRPPLKRPSRVAARRAGGLRLSFIPLDTPCRTLDVFRSTDGLIDGLVGFRLVALGVVAVGGGGVDEVRPRGAVHWVGGEVQQRNRIDGLHHRQGIGAEGPRTSEGAEVVDAGTLSLRGAGSYGMGYSRG